MEFSQPPPTVNFSVPPPTGAPSGGPPPPPHHQHHQRHHYHGGFGNKGGHNNFRPFNSFNRGPGGLPMTQDDFDGKRLRKSVMRKTVDYNSSIIRALEVSRPKVRRVFSLNLPQCSFAGSHLATRLSRSSSPPTGINLRARDVATSELHGQSNQCCNDAFRKNGHQ